MTVRRYLLNSVTVNKVIKFWSRIYDKLLLMSGYSIYEIYIQALGKDIYKLLLHKRDVL